MSSALSADGLGKRYGHRRWALTDCTLEVPSGHVVGLVGPNGAGKTTLLNLAVGLLSPTTGTISVLGGNPADGPKQLAKVGFVAQDTPTYSSLSVGGPPAPWRSSQPRLGRSMGEGQDRRDRN